MTDYPNTRLLIDGIWRDGAAGRILEVLDPATETAIGTVAHAEISDLDSAVAAAERGFSVWSAASAYERARVLRLAADLMRKRARSIAPIMTREQGKPIAEAQIEANAAADVLDWFAGEAQRAYGWTVPARNQTVTQMAVKYPVGPVAAFTPWNFPINQAVRKVAAALAAGCSVVLKAAEETPASTAAMVQALVDAGVPDGAVNLVFGTPSEISEHLVPHPSIRKISFTGSTAVGKQLAALAGAHMKRVTMELGGHSPVIVTADADPDSSVSLMIAHKFRNAGQVCVSPTRFLVEDNAFDRYVGQFSAAAEGLTVGDGANDSTQMGPLANSRRLDALEALVEDAVAQGGTLMSGGRRIGNKGYFFAPTVLADVPVSARVMNEEPFGPIAIMNRWSSLNDALVEANRLPVGLAAYAFSTNPSTVSRISREVRAGMTSINHLGIGLPELPFGGVLDSGYGSEGGAEALDSYLETRLTTYAV